MIIGRILLTDLKRSLADPFMLFMYLTPWLTAIGVKVGWQYMANHYPQWPINDYELLASISVSLLVSMNMGIVLGFQLLEEKEQGVLKAIAVTPMNHHHYLLYRFVVFMAVSLLLALLSHILLDMIHVDIPTLLLVFTLAAFQVPFQALLIAGTANNTIEGFAVMKATGFLLLVPLLVLYFFADHTLSWLAIIFPYFWIVKMYQYLVAESYALVYLSFAIGMIYQLALIYILQRRYCNSALN